MINKTFYFEDALVVLRNRGTARRSNWKPMVPSIRLVKNTIDPRGKLAPPPVQLCQMKKNKDGSENKIPWLPSLSDLLEKDWLIQER